MLGWRWMRGKSRNQRCVERVLTLYHLCDDSPWLQKKRMTKKAQREEFAAVVEEGLTTLQPIKGKHKAAKSISEG